jgi:hypothetical protein
MSREIKFRFWSKILNHFVIPDDSIFAGGLKDPNMAVMQFTGLKDRKGVEIYEGDLLKMAIDTRSEDVRAVEYDEGGFWLGDKPGYEWPLAFIEVIGNIYENPELIEKKGA